jgi:wyosine [tRNA(Phe)-imidazoG37] synthetase (radical SAM superfamily)
MSYESLVFGPVPSRRLGYSLGVNNVYDKYCSYSCVYCQVGRTTRLIIERMKFYDPEKLVEVVVREANVKKPDVISFVPNGEPTLDINLGVEARLIRERTNIPLAIFTNSSLINRDDVRQDLLLFDIVSLKVDTVHEGTWKRINRPHPRLRLENILDGIKSFSKEYRGRILIETMLVKGINDNYDEYKDIAEFLKGVKFYKAYIQVPIRPPAEEWVRIPDNEALVEAYSVFSEKLGEDKVELLAYPETSDFKFSDRLVEEIAKTIHVHPLRIDYIEKIAVRRGYDPSKIINELLEKGYAEIIRYNNVEFLVPKRRVFPKRT